MTHHDTPSEVSTLIAVIADLQERLDKANQELKLQHYITALKTQQEVKNESQAD